MKVNHWKRFTWPILCGFLLIGCQAQDEPLDQFVKQVELRSQKKVKDLAPAIEFQASNYTQVDNRAPFILPRAALTIQQPLADNNCWQPKSRRKNGKLEKFPLSKLQLKGVMGRAKTVSALIQAPNGKVLNATKGQYIGLNNGRITKVTSKYLIINETLPDGLGCWNKRNVKMALR
ncbi:pilus assembly protein PilP [Vibrio sp.]|nr:pilus assembly protein PilP [Vibrio sp.]